MTEMEESQSISNRLDRTTMPGDFKLMVKNVAEDINDLSTLTYMCGMNNTGPDRDKMTTLDILWKLEKRGEFAYNNVGPLESLLKRISRYDLVTKHVEPYKQKYGHLAVKQRARQPFGRPISLPIPMWSDSAQSSLTSIAATKPRSQTDPVQCTQEGYCQRPRHPYCDAVAEEELGSQCSAATPIPSSTQVPLPVQELQERRSRAEAISSSSRSQTPSTLCRRHQSPFSATSDMRTSTPILRTQRNSRPSNILSLPNAELQEQLRRISFGSTASSMVSLTTSSSDVEQWSGSTDEQEMMYSCASHQLHDYNTDQRRWQSRGKFLLDRKKMAKMIAVHKTCHYQYGKDLTTIIPVSTQKRGIKLTFKIFPYGIDADIQSRHATVLVQISQYRLSCQEIADNCTCTIKVKATFTNAMTQERFSTREGEAELSSTSYEACIQIYQALSHSDILYSTANIQMLVEAELHCQDKVVAAISDDQDCPDYVFLMYSPNEQ